MENKWIDRASGDYQAAQPEQPAQQGVENKWMDRAAPENVPQPKEAKKADFQKGLLQYIAKGFTLGFNDEITAAMAALPASFAVDKPLNDVYGEMLTNLREHEAKFKEEYPNTALTAEVGGGLITGGAGGIKLAGKLRGAPKTAKYAVAGAVPGTIAGGGYSDQSVDQPIEDILKNTAIDAGVGTGKGAALGVAVPNAAKLVGAGVNKIKGAFQGPETKALRKIKQALDRDEVTATAAIRNKKLLGENAAMSDLGGANTLGLSEAVANQPGRSMNKAKRFYQGRQGGQRDRVTGLVKKEISNEDFNETKDAIVSEMKTRAKPLYEEAYSVQLTETPMLKALKENGIVKRAMKKAVKDIQDDIELSKDLKNVDMDNPNTVLWDYTKRVIDDIENTAIRGGGGNKARIHGNVRRTITKELDKQNSSYSSARKVWEDSSRNLDAIDKGRAIFKEAGKDLSLSKKEFTKLSETQKELYRVGAADELIRVVKNTNDTLEGISPSLYGKIFSSPTKREAIEIMFGNKQNFKKFAREIERERIFNNNKNVVMGNSSTAKRQALQDDLQIDTSIAMDAAEAVHGSPSAIQRMIKRVKSATRDEKLDREMADRLFSNDINVIKDTLDKIQQQGSVLPKWAAKFTSMGNQQAARWVSGGRNSDKLMEFVAGSSGTL